MTNSNSTYETAWDRMTDEERRAHSERMIAMAKASRGRHHCSHGVSSLGTCMACDAEHRDEYAKGQA